MKLYWSIKKRIYGIVTKKYAIKIRKKARILLDRTNWIDKRILINQPYEDDQITTLNKLVSKENCEYLIDIGANIGLYTVIIGKNPSIKTIIAFEPVKRNFNQLCANIFINELDYISECHNIALSNINNTSTIFIDPTSTGVSTLSKQYTNRNKKTYTSKQSTECKIFDEIYQIEGVRAIIKIDVEGHELFVLKGMQKFLTKNKVILQVECNFENKEPLVGFINKLDYEEIKNPNGDLRFTNIKY